MNNKYINLTSPFLTMGDLVLVLHLCRSQVYNLIKSGLFMQPVKITNRRRLWLALEVQQWMEAKIASKSDTEIKTLVATLQNARKMEDK